ncbi:MAG: class 1 fructose-bisphosphatase [Candidatus Levybacteria bacterium]|nr:class 1 fructose-bisphosphatase [Candidatus Levybacteria bacterium]
MFTKPTSLIEFILAEEKKAHGATGTLTLLLTHIDYATRIIASHIARAGLVDILGTAGKKNIYQDEVQKLDEQSNQLLIDILSSTGVVSILASEELEKPIHVDTKGKYMVFFDPIDGSSNIDVNASVGTIFSIYHTSGSLLQPGKKQVAAGYVIYGSSTMFVYACGHGVNGFTLDPTIGSFLLSHPLITIPEKGNIYSVNEGNAILWDEKIKAYIDRLKNKGYKSRYIGTMVADLHRTLLKGGIFLYPKDSKHPQGKLRLLYEVNPAAFLITQAGGMAVSHGKDPLTLIPSSLHQTAPIALGSKHEVSLFAKDEIH